MSDRTHSDECFRWHHDCAVAEVERRRAEVAEHLLRADSLRAELARCQAENERMEAAVQAVRNMHRESFPDPEGRTGCTACAVTWPCATIRHVDASPGR